MTWGVATALLEQQGDEGLFEVDEAWLPRVAAELEPAPDRARQPVPRPARPLRRAGAPRRRVGASWWRPRAGRPGSSLNADDPLIADLGRDRDLARRPGVTYFGIEDPSQALPELQHAFDAKHCRRCGAPYAYERAFVGHLGHYSLPELRRRPARRPTSPRPASSWRECAARASPCARPRARSSCASPSPASTTSTTRSPR